MAKKYTDKEIWIAKRLGISPERVRNRLNETAWKKEMQTPEDGGSKEKVD